jgi:hypothetical protein
MGNTHRATIRPSCWTAHQRRPCDDTAVTDVLLGKAGTTEPLLLLPFLGQRVSERGASSVGTRVSGSYRRRTLLSHLSAADRSRCPCCFMSRRVLLPIRLDGGLSRGLGTSGRVTLRRSAIGRPKTIQAIVDKRQHMLTQQCDQLSFSVSSARAAVPSNCHRRAGRKTACANPVAPALRRSRIACRRGYG